MSAVTRLLRESPEIAQLFAPVLRPRQLKTVATIELNSRNTELGKLAARLRDEALDAGDIEAAIQFDRLHAEEMANPETRDALVNMGRLTTGVEPRYVAATGRDPYGAAGSFTSGGHSSVAPNVRLAFPGGADVGEFDARVGQGLEQDVMAALGRIDANVNHLPPAGQVRGYSVDVPAGNAPRERLEQFRAALGDHEISNYPQAGGMVGIDVNPVFGAKTIGPDLEQVYDAANRTFGERPFGMRAHNVVFEGPGGQSVSDYVERPDYAARLEHSTLGQTLAGDFEAGGAARNTGPGSGPGVSPPRGRPAANAVGSLDEAQAQIAAITRRLEPRLAAYIEEIGRKYGIATALTVALAIQQEALNGEGA
jgi:hypothetical protein